MALPIIIQGLVFQLQTVVDKAFLGKIDTNYLSAVGVAQLPFFTSVDALTAICTGLTIIVAMKFGAGKQKEIHESVNAAIAFNLMLSLSLFIIWMAFPDIILSWMNVNDTLVPYCNDYIRTLSYFLILFGVDISLQATLQGMGKTKPIMYVGLVKVLLNILLAWIFIFGKFGFPAMYVYGAALATTIANITGTLILIVYFAMSRELSPNLKLREIFLFRWDLYNKIIRLGLPTGTEYLLWNVSNLILVSLLNKQGVKVVAVFTVTYAIEIFVYMIFNGISKATLTLVGNSIGAGKKSDAKSIMTSSIRYTMLFVLLFCIIFAVFPKPILSILRMIRI
jgi:putative MATE family efflux protein